MKKTSVSSTSKFWSGISSGLLACLGILVLAGCHKHPTATTAPVSAATPAPVDDAVHPSRPVFIPPATPDPVAAGAETGVDLKAINHAYIGWIVQSHQRPKTFEAFVAASGMQIPPAPAGKKFIIDKSGFINLVNQ